MSLILANLDGARAALLALGLTELETVARLLRSAVASPSRPETDGDALTEALEGTLGALRDGFALREVTS